MKNQDFEDKVKQIVQSIPYGRVCTYGLIAQAAGLKSSARLVGYILNSLADDKNFPCHRVVNRLGELTGRMHFITPTLMKELLLYEGVEFDGDKVIIKKYLWYPQKFL